jgi:hypothetical protein
VWRPRSLSDPAAHHAGGGWPGDSSCSHEVTSPRAVEDGKLMYRRPKRPASSRRQLLMPLSGRSRQAGSSGSTSGRSVNQR